MIKKYKAYFKLEPTFEVDTEGLTDEQISEAEDNEIQGLMVDISMNPYDFISFEEVK